MKVTRPEMRTALLYLSATAVERNQRYMVVAIMLARANERQLYTAWYCMAHQAHSSVYTYAHQAHSVYTYTYSMHTA